MDEEGVWDFCKLAANHVLGKCGCRDPLRVSSVPFSVSRPGNVNENFQLVQEQEFLWSCWEFICEPGFFIWLFGPVSWMEALNS